MVRKFKPKTGGPGGGNVEIISEPSENLAVKRRAVEVS